MRDSKDAFRVMTSGVFTAAHLALIPAIEAYTGQPVVTLTTSIGTGEQSIPNRLRRREPADLVIVAEPNMVNFVQARHILADTRTLIARSVAAVAVRAGEPPPDASSPDALKRTFLRARSIAYSASESGKYLTTQLYHRLGIDKECLPKSRFVGNGERTGAVVARGEADLAFQQVSELRPVPGIAHITPIPDELQSYVWVATGAVAWSRDIERARAVARFLASDAAAPEIVASGLDPLFGEDLYTALHAA
ncbi:substrate-binding domain-containing protein [Achromobacter aloeverae]|uniref:ABC transporter substrate-binding protein n=1 Tax=Achromobacter aloeverae TaxID=1750518 RepID=A0A4Q1HMY7_9BURK|nr:substrate-binding domain-containing protein [Achromobacter aloeverae]RXN92249.1 ABC transporter substrate-binding protein [Achromobacter aloeverae]